jgi:hypothetical protein
MPFGDRTGPAGLGPRTGRGAGYCGGFGVPGSSNRTGSYGFFGRGSGRGGRGWRNWFFATGLTGWQRGLGWPWGGPGAYVPEHAGPSREEELGVLKDQAGFFQRTLESIQRRIEALETKTKPE